MSSCITTGTTVDCSQISPPGGIQRIWLAEKDAVLSQTFDVDGNIDTITMQAAPPNLFYEFEFEDFQAQFTEDFPRSDTGVVQGTQTLTFTIAGRNGPLRRIIQDLLECRCGLYVIHQEFTGEVWIWGYLNKRRAKAGNTADSGTALSDQNQEVITLTCLTTEKAVIFNPGVAGIPV